MKLYKYILSTIIAVSSVSYLSSCGSDDNTIVVGASSAPHAEILEQIKPLIEEKGYALKIKTFSDYVLPNTTLQDGELDANYFQHITYLNNFNEEHNTTLVSVGNIHYEPFGIYAGSKNDLSLLSENDKIIIPNDTTNEARALLLLQENNIITLKENVGINATKKDIILNPKNVEIIEMNAELIASVKDDAAFAIINGNYAIANNIKVSDALAIEDKDGIAATAYANVLAVKKGNEKNEKTTVLYEALTSATVKEFINSKYSGSVIALF